MLTFLLGLGAHTLGLRSLGVIPPFETMPLLALAGAVVGLTRLRGALWALGGLTTAALLGIGFTPLAVAPGRALVRSDPLERAEAVVVLAGGIQTDGEIGPVMQARLVRGYGLLRAGWARELVVTEVPASAAPAGPPVRRQMEDWVWSIRSTSWVPCGTPAMRPSG